MLSWQWIWVFVILPLPLLVRWLLPAQEQAAQAIRVPFYDQLNAIQQQQSQSRSSAVLKIIPMALIWFCLVSAVARPTWIGEAIPIPQEHRDLMLAVDISGSMRASDMRLNNGYATRIDVVKYVVGDFVKQRIGDRIGLILFGEQAYLQTPLTFDKQAIQQQLLEAQLGFAGNSTAVGDTIGLAVKHLRDRPAESRILILLTDGANTAGTDPRQAMAIAKEANIRIHTIGVGAPRRGRPSGDLDEALLTDIATETGGRYFRARNPDELQKIYNLLDQLEPLPEEQIFRPTISLMHWPLAIAILLSVLMACSHLFKGLFTSRASSFSSSSSTSPNSSASFKSDKLSGAK